MEWLINPIEKHTKDGAADTEFPKHAIPME